MCASKALGFHLLRYRRIQSEMQIALHEKPSPPFNSVNLEEWQSSMHDRIRSWYEETPASNVTLSRINMTLVETFELTYHTALFYLYRPSPNILSPTGLQLTTMSQSAVKLIELYRRFFLERKLTIYWHAVEHLFSAGTSLMASYAQSTHVRNSISFRSLESTVHLCSSVLWGMVERFPVFQGKRDEFDAVVSRMLPAIQTGTFIESSDLEGSSPSFRNYASGASVTSNTSTWALDSQQFFEDIHTADVYLETISKNVENAGQMSQFPAELLTRRGESEASKPALSQIDGADLSMVWDATANLNGTLPPMWL